MTNFQIFVLKVFIGMIPYYVNRYTLGFINFLAAIDYNIFTRAQ